MSRRVTHVLATVLFLSYTMSPVLAADSSQVNFKIFSPPGGSPPADSSSSEAAPAKGAEAGATGTESMWTEGDPGSQAPPGSPPPSAAPAASASPAGDASASTTSSATPASGDAATSAAPASDASASAAASTPADSSSTAATTTTTDTPKTDTASTDASGATGTDANKDAAKDKDGKVLQGYIRVVPSGTKLPIIMDSAVDSDTSQEGDEFAARTSEDLTIDGSTVVPAGSVIKGRIARINAPKHLNRSGSVGLKFDTITTPDNKQIALQATLVARGGVVHARRGMKDIALDTGMVAAPMALGAAIGAVAGGLSKSSSSSSGSSSSSSKIGLAGGLIIGVGVGTAIGVVILCAKKGKRVDMRPGDELKIELAEDLRMPM